MSNFTIAKDWSIKLTVLLQEINKAVPVELLDSKADVGLFMEKL